MYERVHSGVNCGHFCFHFSLIHAIVHRCTLLLTALQILEWLETTKQFGPLEIGKNQRILITTRGETRDIKGMKALIEDIKSHDFQPDIHFLTDLVRLYIFKGLKDKVIALLKEVGEGNSHEECIRARNKLFYASLDMANDVSRICNHCKSDPTMLECETAIRTWGELGKVEEAKAVFEMVSLCSEQPDI
ncbi:hypothetical protein Fmac_011681 [Flemingia macrophylla]|uniref:Uncharacterized protein n=1 Tax=Flemingia macrophylla TaxID=520843 RepID=A0ABD1MQ78_9FABA